MGESVKGSLRKVGGGGREEGGQKLSPQPRRKKEEGIREGPPSPLSVPTAM